MIEFIIAALVVCVDQLVKQLTVIYLSPVGTSYVLIPGVFQLTNAHNTGAAWGMFQGGRWFFIAMTLIVCSVLTYYLIRERKKLHLFPRIILSLILGGALGNLIDRIFLGYVRDMFDFCLIHFPIFNVADSALSIGSVLLVVNILFMPESSALVERDRKNPGDKKENESDGAEKSVVDAAADDGKPSPNGNVAKAGQEEPAEDSILRDRD